MALLEMQLHVIWIAVNNKLISILWGLVWISNPTLLQKS